MYEVYICMFGINGLNIYLKKERWDETKEGINQNIEVALHSLPPMILLHLVRPRQVPIHRDQQKHVAVDGECQLRA